MIVQPHNRKDLQRRRKRYHEDIIFLKNERRRFMERHLAKVQSAPALLDDLARIAIIVGLYAGSPDSLTHRRLARYSLLRIWWKMECIEHTHSWWEAHLRRYGIEEYHWLPTKAARALNPRRFRKAG